MGSIADRVVEVLLRLKTDQYKREAGEAADKTERLKRGIDDVDDELKKLPADATKAAAAMKLLGTEAIGTGNYIKGVGDKGTALQVLDMRIREAEVSVRRLGQEFVRTGSVDVFQHLNRADADLRSLTAMRKRLADALETGARDGAKAASGTFAQVFQGGVVAAFQSLPSEAKVAIVASLVAVAAATAPLIGAAVTSAILGGVGAAGIGAGIALAAQDPAVRQAWAGLGSWIGERLKDSARPFQAELISTAGIFGLSFHRIAPDLDSIFSRLARNIQPLAMGLTQLVENAMPGIRRAVDAAGPVLQALADNLPQMGRALDQFFSSIAAGGPGATAGFKFILVSVEALIVALGWLFEALSKVFGVFDKIARGVRGLFTGDNGNLTRQLADVGTSADKASTGMDSFARKLDFAQDKLNKAQQQLGATKVTLDSLAASMVNKIFSATMNLDQATLRWHQSLTTLNETLKRNGKTIDENTEKGQNNRQAILAAVTANMQIYQAQIAAGMSAKDAAANYDTNTAALEKQLRKAGLTTAQIDALIGKYKGIPGEVNSTLAIEGLTKAIQDLTDLIAKINGIDNKNFHSTYTMIYKEKGRPPVGEGGTIPRVGAYAHGGIRRAASGLVVPPSDPGSVLFGEPQTGGEALIPLQGITQRRAMELMQTAGAGYGLDVVPSRWRGGRSSGPSTVVVQATFVDPVDGTVTRRQIVTAAANRGQSVAQFLGVN